MRKVSFPHRRAGHTVEERMQPFHLRAIERGSGAAVSAADFYAFQQRQGAWGRDAA